MSLEQEFAIMDLQRVISELKAENRKLKEGLQNIIRHQVIAGGSIATKSATYNIAMRALE
jgi:hypothetical protein